MMKLHFVHRASPASLFHSALLSVFLSLILAERRWESSEFKMHLQLGSSFRSNVFQSVTADFSAVIVGKM